MGFHLPVYFFNALFAVLQGKGNRPPESYQPFLFGKWILLPSVCCGTDF